MQLTAKQYGAWMRAEGILWPAPRIDKADLTQPGVTVHRIGQRQVGNALLLIRRGWGTVYVAPKFGDYQGAFDEVMPTSRLGTQVDHLYPKSRALPHEMVALGRIARLSNISINNRDGAPDLSNKVLEAWRRNPHQFTSTLTDMERGWAVVACYLRPRAELRGFAPQPLTHAEIDAGFA